MNVAVDTSPVFASGTKKITPVILSGGSGTRLWPLSRTAYPKQLLSLTSERSLLQETVSRTLGGEFFADPLIVCNDEHRFGVEDQLRDIGAKAAHILLEPIGRNTAPAVTAAALWLAERDPDAMMLVQPSDHAIGEVSAFHRAIACGLPSAEAGRLITFGIKPTRPETGYGYIRVGAPLDSSSTVYVVDTFVEKPDREVAESYVGSGQFLWNSGIFLFAAGHYLAELQRINPEMYAACQRAYEEGAGEEGCRRLEPTHFAAAPSLSIDRAVMERTSFAAVVPVDMAWSDVGSWRALHDNADHDADGNVTHGDVVLSDVHNSYIRAGDRLIAAIGLDNIVVVCTDDAILVAAADRVAEVSGVVERLRLANRPEPQQHTTVRRPWGYYRTTDQGDRFQVKRIVVKPGARLSLQKHFHRAEHWVVVQGTAIVQRGEERSVLRENESIYIPLGTEHRLENPGKIPLHLVEVQSGSYLGEDDIVRISDSYGRT